MRHTRGTPPAVVETDPETWVALASGRLSWAEADAAGAIVAGDADLSAFAGAGSRPTPGTRDRHQLLDRLRRGTRPRSRAGGGRGRTRHNPIPETPAGAAGRAPRRAGLRRLRRQAPAGRAQGDRGPAAPLPGGPGRRCLRGVRALPRQVGPTVRQVAQPRGPRRARARGVLGRLRRGCRLRRALGRRVRRSHGPGPPAASTPRLPPWLSPDRATWWSASVSSESPGRWPTQPWRMRRWGREDPDDEQRARRARGSERLPRDGVVRAAPARSRGGVLRPSCGATADESYAATASRCSAEVADLPQDIDVIHGQHVQCGRPGARAGSRRARWSSPHTRGSCPSRTRSLSSAQVRSWRSTR